MLITDYSNQDYSASSLRGAKATWQPASPAGGSHSSHLLPELLTAGMIFILPIIFLLVLSAH